MKFTSSYVLSGTEYMTDFFALDRDHAKTVLRERHMGETLVPYDTDSEIFLPSELLEQWRFREAIHAVCWLGMVGCAANVTDGFVLLNDHGAVHCIAHLARMPKRAFKRKHLTDKLRLLILKAYWQTLKIELLVPGFQRYPEDEITLPSTPLESMQEISARVHDTNLEWFVANFPVFK